MIAVRVPTFIYFSTTGFICFIFVVLPRSHLFLPRFARQHYFTKNLKGASFIRFSCHPPLACAQDLSRTLLDTNGENSSSFSFNAGMLLGLSRSSQRGRTLCGTTRSSFPMDCHEYGCVFVIDFSRYQALSSNKKSSLMLRAVAVTRVSSTHTFLDTVGKPLWLSELR